VDFTFDEPFIRLTGGVIAFIFSDHLIESFIDRLSFRGRSERPLRSLDYKGVGQLRACSHYSRIHNSGAADMIGLY
jgi:hypothetical protein